MSIHVVRTFVQLRGVLASNKELAQKLMELERRVDTGDSSIVGILKQIRDLTNVPQTRAIGFVWMTETQSHDLIKQLLQHGARPEIAGPNGPSAWSVAAMFGEDEIIELLSTAPLHP